MTLLRAIRSDLVDKRLWPLAVLLLIAVAAVPVVVPKLGGTASPVAPPPALAAGASGPVVAHQVSVVSDSPWTQRAHGRYHDPFRQPRAASSSPSASSTTSAGGGAASAASVAGAAAIPSPAPSTSPSTPVVRPKPLPKPSPVKNPTPGANPTPVAGPTPVSGPPGTPRGILAGYRLDVLWGGASKTSEHLNIPRLTGLRAAHQPVVAFLGVRSGGKVATFLLSGVAWVIGDGTCRPSRQSCQVVELRQGQSEFFNVPGQPDLPYELKVTKLSEKRTATEAEATAFRHRKAKTGATMLTQAIAAGETFVSRYAYDWAHGVLTLRGASAAATGQVSASSQGSPPVAAAWPAGTTTGQ
jgi:hypothetical protein